MKEPTIAINGYVLTEGQALAARVAITLFHTETGDPKLRKELGEELADAYHARLAEVLGLILRGEPNDPNL